MAECNRNDNYAFSCLLDLVMFQPNKKTDKFIDSIRLSMYINMKKKRTMKESFFFLKHALFLLISMFICFYSNAQLYDDYYGNGHNLGVKVKSSGTNTDASETLTGSGILPDLQGASRFLSQSALGHNFDDIEYVQNIGIEGWIDEQISMDYTPFSQTLTQIQSVAQNITRNTDFNNGELISFAFYSKIFTQSDKLRQKMANALLQILVISQDVQTIGVRAYEASTYYDILYDGAFGNYRNILERVSLHPMMGVYLSHFRNAQANYTLNTYPDENYAREIMQLFSIGLIKLNLDGTPIMDENGNEIPTYNNDDIREMAKVFTGLAGGENNNGSSSRFQDGTFKTNLAVPMKLFQEEHDITEKRIIDGIVLPSGRSGTEDLKQTLDILFNHPNVGPFLSIRLIQHFIKSNPTPEYVKRVATVFNDNGKGVRGDMGAVIKAILMDPEARDCDWIENPANGKLLQPIERFTKLFCAFNVRTPSGRYFYNDEGYSGRLGQAFFNSPSVFNFFSPFYAEDKVVKPAGMVSPEFEIFNSVTSIEYFNQAEDRAKKTPFKNRTGRNDNNLTTNNSDEPRYNFSQEINILNNQGLTALMDRLNILLCRGQLSISARNVIQNTLNQYQTNVNNYSDEDLIRDAIYFITISPDFIIQN